MTAPSCKRDAPEAVDTAEPEQEAPPVDPLAELLATEGLTLPRLDGGTPVEPPADRAEDGAARWSRPVVFVGSRRILTEAGLSLDLVCDEAGLCDVGHPMSMTPLREALDKRPGVLVAADASAQLGVLHRIIHLGGARNKPVTLLARDAEGVLVGVDVEPAKAASAALNSKLRFMASKTRFERDPVDGTVSVIHPEVREPEGMVERIRGGALQIPDECGGLAAARETRLLNQDYHTCYRQAVARTPGLSGTLELRWTIGNDGRAADVEQSGGDVADPALVQCLADALGRVAYKPHGGPVERCRVTWTLRLELREAVPAERAGEDPAAALPMELRVEGGTVTLTGSAEDGPQKVPLADTAQLERRIQAQRSREEVLVTGSAGTRADQLVRVVLLLVQAGFDKVYIGPPG
jgi:hypothetical protein